MAAQETHSPTVHPNPLLAFEPILTPEQIQEREAINVNDVRRRIMLATLTRSGQQLLDGFTNEESAGALMESIEQMEYYHEYLTALLEFTECASARLIVVADTIIEKLEGGGN